MNECKCDSAPPGPDPKGSAFAQILPMLAGPKAGEVSVSAALLAQGRKQQAWLDRRGRLAGETKKMLEERERGDRARLRQSAGQLFAAASIPEASAEEMTIGGRVTKDGTGQEGLVVSAIGRDGKAHGCATTDPRGSYRIALRDDGEVLLQVTSAGGRKRLYLDDQPIPFERGGIAIRNIDLGGSGEQQRPCPDGPDTSGRLVMPDVVGMPADEAERKLKSQKIEVAGRRKLVRTGFEDRVIATEPEAGRLLEMPPKTVLTIGARGEEPKEEKPKEGKPTTGPRAQPESPRASAATQPDDKATKGGTAGPATAKAVRAAPAKSAPPRS
jgi:hypothetical protein